jgi:lipoate-protein ligase A
VRVRIQLQRRSFPGRPAFDAAVSRALLEGIAAGHTPPTLRLYAPGDVLAFSVFDRTRAGFSRAVSRARAHGFQPVLRLAGGRAAVFHGGCVAFAWSSPAPDPRHGIRRRFDDMAEIARAALRGLGADARIGPVPGEYCPGAHSVNARGRTKLVGIGQRVIRGAAHVGGVVVVREGQRVRDVLVPVYRELGFDFDPRSVGSLEDEVGPVSPDDVIAALVSEFRRRAELVEADFEAGQLALAERLEPRYRAGGLVPADPPRLSARSGGAGGSRRAPRSRPDRRPS